MFESGIPITMIGLDVTHKALIYPDEVEVLRKLGKVGKILAELMDFYAIFYSKQFKGNPIHDAVAVASVFQPDIVSTRHLNVTVETSGEFTLGRTVVDFRGVTGRKVNCDVALGLDREGIIELIFRCSNLSRARWQGIMPRNVLLANAKVIGVTGTFRAQSTY